MSLLSSGQRRQIRDVIKQVTDTFMVTDIQYHFAAESLDLFNEDRNDQVFNTVNLKGLVEHNIEDDKIIEKLQGSRDNNIIQVTFNLEDLEVLSLITSDYKFVGNATTDYFTMKGELYKILDLRYDGPLDSKDVLVVLEGEKSTETIALNNSLVTGDQVPVDEIVAGNLTEQIDILEDRIDELENEDHIEFETLPDLPCPEDENSNN